MNKNYKRLLSNKDEFSPRIRSLEFASDDESVEEAIKRMRHLKMPSDVIENFKNKGEPEFCMSNGKRVPLNAADIRAIRLLNNVGYLVYAALQYDGEFGKGSLYVVVSRLKTRWETERRQLENNQSLAYAAGSEFKVISLECLPDGMLKRSQPENGELIDVDVVLSEKLPFPENGNGDISMDELSKLWREIDTEYYICRHCIENSADWLLTNMFYDSCCYVHYYTNDHIDVFEYNADAYVLTCDLNDAISILGDISLMSQGTFADIIARSGLSNQEFCEKLGVGYSMPDAWDSESLECPNYYRYLMGRYLGIISEPSFVRDAFSYAVGRILDIALENPEWYKK